MQTINCFEVLGNTDTTEGRGPMKVVARFSTRAVAEKYIKSRDYAKYCVMGCLSQYDINNIKKTTIIIFDTQDELKELETIEAKTVALNKSRI